jgi:hypothetical protein
VNGSNQTFNVVDCPESPPVVIPPPEDNGTGPVDNTTNTGNVTTNGTS